MLKWLDILKLSVPVLTAFAVIWARHTYERRRERRFLEETVWRCITDEPQQFQAAFDLLHRIVASVKNGKVVIMGFDLPRVTVDAAQRLSQLDTRNAYVYASYISYVNLANGYIAKLHDLLRDYFRTDKVPPTRLTEAIEFHARCVEGTLREVMKCDLQILEALERDGLSKPEPQAAVQVKTAHRHALEAPYVKP